MALRLYLSPVEQAGGFAGVPRQTQCFSSPWGPPRGNGVVDTANPMTTPYWLYKEILEPGINLPVFPLTTVMPTGAATIISHDIPLICRQGGPSGTQNMFTRPVCLGVIQITSDLSVNPTDFIPLSAGFGGVGRWVCEYKTTGGNLDPHFPNTEHYQLQPNVAYIWRPSTASMVGMLWCCYGQVYGTGNGPDWGLSSDAWRNNLQPSYNLEWPTDNYIWTFDANTFCRVGSNSPPIQVVGNGNYQTVAALAGDVLVVEYHIIGHVLPFGTPTSGHLTFSMAIGGGTDATPEGTRTVNGNNDYWNEATPIHNTFIDLPTLSSITFPTGAPSPAYGPPPNLIAVDPGTGPRISLTFDNPVGIVGPTLGAKVGPINVSGATQVDATHIDLSLDIHKPVTGIGF